MCNWWEAAAGDVVADLGDELVDEARDPFGSQVGGVGRREVRKCFIAADEVGIEHPGLRRESHQVLAVGIADAESMAKLNDKVDVPLATGEMLYTRHEFSDLIKRKAVDIIQPDICFMGGLWEMKKMAAMADANYVTVTPHNPCGPVATAVNVHFAASTSNFLILEYHADDEGPRQIVVEPIKLVDGYLELPETPGLGIDLNLEAVAKYPFKSWHRVFQYRPDGSLSVARYAPSILKIEGQAHSSLARCFYLVFKRGRFHSRGLTPSLSAI